MGLKYFIKKFIHHEFIDKIRFKKKHPEFADINFHMVNSQELLDHPYRDYKKNISPGNSAISLNVGAFLKSVSEIKQPKNILDLGSGFSSYVFRRYKAESLNEAHVYSVDSDKLWLEKTRDYLTGNNLNNQNMYHWEEFKKIKKPLFDLIFVDIRPIERRLKYFNSFVSYLSKSGAIIYDDCHKPHLLRPLYDKVKQSAVPLRHYNIKKYTIDEIGRFDFWIEHDE
jgi:predicted O-methyltransferase YrrM